MNLAAFEGAAADRQNADKAHATRPIPSMIRGSGVPRFAAGLFIGSRGLECDIRPQPADPRLPNVGICRVDPLDVCGEMEPRGDCEIVVDLHARFVVHRELGAAGILQVIA